VLPLQITHSADDAYSVPDPYPAELDPWFPGDVSDGYDDSDSDHDDGDDNGDAHDAADGDGEA